MTSDESMLKECMFHIVSVPTPINIDKTPNLEPIIGASKIIGRNLKKGSIIVYESTVYPGTTEEICIPVLEEYSGLKFGEDFTVGYSPERINPGDKENTLTNITKVVSGSDNNTLEIIFQVYDSIINAGIHKASTIKVAEAAKVIENAQRDINIAFMNELSIVFNKMNIDTNEVLAAAGTKWNFLNFKPGLVGGHCIGVDPYYFIYKAEQLGYHSQIIGAGRKINDEMGKYVASNIIKKIIQSGQVVRDSKVLLLGISFKPDVADVRNSKIIDIITELKDYGVNPLIYDPVANKREVERTYGLELIGKSEIPEVSAIVLSVPHKEILNDIEDICEKSYGDAKVFIDINGKCRNEKYIDKEYYWSL